MTRYARVLWMICTLSLGTMACMAGSPDAPDPNDEATQATISEVQAAPAADGSVRPPPCVIVVRCTTTGDEFSGLSLNGSGQEALTLANQACAASGCTSCKFEQSLGLCH